jgi:hypothetical protein
MIPGDPDAALAVSFNARATPAQCRAAGLPDDAEVPAIVAIFATPGLLPEPERARYLTGWLTDGTGSWYLSKSIYLNRFMSG